MQSPPPREGTSISGGRGGGGGGLGPGIEFRGKIWGKVQSSSSNKSKIWGVLLLQDAKIGKESQFWGHLGLYLKFKGQNLGYLSPIFLEAKIWGSDMNFRGKIWGQAPPTSLYGSTPWCPVVVINTDRLCFHQIG